MGKKNTDIKVVGLCSKHCQNEFEYPRDKYGTYVNDEDISCIECCL